MRLELCYQSGRPLKRALTLAHSSRAFGAHGERVSRADDMPGAIARCLQALDEGRSALLVASIARI